jgi:hypothetical protein
LRRTTFGACLLVAAVATAVVSCSSDEPKREFDVPKALCGVSVPAEALAALLPAAGEQIAVKEESRAGCAVTVDEDVVLRVERQRIDAGRSAWTIASYDHGIGHVKTADGDAVAYVARAAVSVVTCRTPGDEGRAVSTYIRTLKPGRQDEAAMKELISGYTDAFAQQQPCRQVT